MKAKSSATSVVPESPAVRATGYFSAVKVSASPDGAFIIHRLPSGARIQKAANLYRHVLGLEYTKVAPALRPAPQLESVPILGFVGDVRLVLSRDGRYLIHYLPEGRIVQPVDIYHQLLAPRA